MLSPSSGSRKKPAAALPPPASMEERDWAALPGDILFAVFHRLRSYEIMAGADSACSSWRRVAVGEPKLWRSVDMGKDRRWSNTKRWRAMARAAVDRAAGQCEAFSGPCDDDFLLYLIKRAPSLKSLHLSHKDPCKVALCVTLLKNLPLLEDVDISLSYFSDCASQVLFETICEACPHLKNLRMSFQVNSDSNYYDDDLYIYNEKTYVIPAMCELRSLELLGYNLTAAGLTAIIDNCPLLDSLNVTGGIFIDMMDQELRAKCARVKNLTLPYDSDDDYYEQYDPYEGYASDYTYEEFY